MREPRAVGWMKYFDGRIAFEKYSAFIPDDALSLGWRKLYTDDALQAAAVEAQNQQARNAELEQQLAALRELLSLIRDDLRLRSEDGVVDLSDFIWMRMDKALQETPHD